jgi:transcriptional regulator with XRE-family HTH domain
MPRPKGFLIDGRLLQAQRKSAGLTQDQLASRCGLTRSLVQKAERGGPLAPTTIAILAANLGVEESRLIVAEDWNRTVEERIVEPFEPAEAPKIGTVWVQSREMLYQMPALLIQALALRSVVRVLPAFSPRSREGTGHFRRLVAAARTALLALDFSFTRKGPVLGDAELLEHADACYMAVGFTKGAQYDEDAHAADAAFAVATALGRVLDSILEARRMGKKGAPDAHHWRSMEHGAMACHAAAHVSVYLTAEDAFIRAATLDTHDLRNSKTPGAVLAGPLWEGGDLPAPMRLYMSRFLREEYFPREERVVWNGWVRSGFC